MSLAKSARTHDLKDGGSTAPPEKRRKTMKWRLIAGTAGIAGIALAVAAPGWAQQPAPQKRQGSVWSKEAPTSATVEVRDQKGKVVGNIALTAGESGIAMNAKFAGLPPGVHGFHIHDKGICKGDFATAGGHFNPGHTKHGILNDAGRHAGDLPNLDVPASGAVNLDLFLTGVSLTPGSPINLNDTDGASFVVHAGPDDYKSDPSGNSGGRIACGVVKVAKPPAANPAPAKPAAPK
jgi:Cu-Zn family superoxide dismutase